MRSIGELAGLRFVAAGTGLRGRSAEVALALGAAPVDDLRAALAGAHREGDAGIDVVILAAPGEFAAAGAGPDLDALGDCRDRGVVVVSLEPIPGSMLAFAHPTTAAVGTGEDAGTNAGGRAAGAAWDEAAVFVPRFRSSRTFSELEDALGDFGTPRFVIAHCLARRGEGSLGARLFDALDSVRTLMGDPELVHAAYVPAPGAPGPRDLPTDSIRGLDGTVSVVLQYSDGRAASIVVSDASAAWARSLTLIGDQGNRNAGRLVIGDEAFEWIGADGTLLDASRPARAKKPRGTGPSPGAKAIAAHLLTLLNRRGIALVPIDYPRALAAASTVLLSARTGQAESPSTMLRMLGPD